MDHRGPMHFSLFLILFAHLYGKGGAVPSPIECRASHGCTLSNYQGIWNDRLPCNLSQVVYPSTEEELVAAVAEAVKQHQKMKVGTQSSHSIPKLACPHGEDGLLISTRDYARHILVNHTTHTATVDPGVELARFVAEIASRGFTIPHTPMWSGVSVAGAIATGSHGSGFWLKGSCISEYVVGMRIVVPASAEEGYAKVLTLTEEDDDLKAARISLGVLGAISQITFSVLPMFKRSVALQIADDESLEDTVEAYARSQDFAQLSWIPSAGKVVFRNEDHVPVETPGEGENTFPLLLPMTVSKIEEMRLHQDNIERLRDSETLCKAGDEIAQRRLETGDGYTNDGSTFTGFPVVGFNHLMQSAGGCQHSSNWGEHILQMTPLGMELVPPHEEDGGLTQNWLTCKWDPRICGFFYFHTAISIPLTKLRDFIADLKKLRSLNRAGLCSLNMWGGIMMRFVPKSEIYLGEREDCAVVETIYYRSKTPNTPRFNEDVMEEVEQMLLLKYGGKPHWGKNRDVSFESMAGRVSDMEKFLEVKERLDPHGLFSSEWSDNVLGIGREVNIYKDFCALEGMCICKEDNHCAPERGYFCREGKIYAKARVCRHEKL